MTADAQRAEDPNEQYGGFRCGEKEFLTNETLWEWLCFRCRGFGRMCLTIREFGLRLPELDYSFPMFSNAYTNKRSFEKSVKQSILGGFVDSDRALDATQRTMTQQELLQEFCVSLSEEDSASFRGLFELGIIKFELRRDGDINPSLTFFGRLVLAQIRKESISGDADRF